MRLVEPVAWPAAVRVSLAPRLDTLEGKRIGLWANRKLNSAELLGLVEAELRRRCGIGEVVRGTYDPGRVVPPDGWGPVDTCDAVVLAIGDCGSCSTTGLLNQIALEGRGVPTMLIATDMFRGALEATRSIAGLESARWGEVRHPIGSLDAAELRDRAVVAVDQFCAIVVSDAQESRSEHTAASSIA